MEAWYVYASQYHGGQGSALYQVLGRLHRLGFKPRLLVTRTDLTRNGRAVYDNLFARKVGIQ